MTTSKKIPDLPQFQPKTFNSQLKLNIFGKLCFWFPVYGVKIQLNNDIFIFFKPTIYM